MSIAAGTRLGPYEVITAIGAGGMGAVYKARDTRLHRDVAIKVLPPEVAGDAGRLRRFEDEARAAAALNHSNILALYDIGTDNGLFYIVTELLDGRTLREVLADERLATSRAIDLAAQIADGLAAAHGRNIVHRDLKPENIFVTADGRAKILDFGLAKTLEPLAEPATVETKAATAPYTVLGTTGYMAPEQVRAQAVDHRADVFTFGAVLYEMLNGKRAFAGDTALDAMSAILHEAPAAIGSTMERPVPPSLLRIVDRCLEKMPSARFQSMTDLAFALKTLSQSDTMAWPAAGGATPVLHRWRWRQAWPWGLVTALTIALVLMWQPWRRPVREASSGVIRFTINPPVGGEFGSAGISPFPALSPDGQQLVYQANRDKTQSLWLRPLAGVDATPLGIDGSQPFWSPDGRSIAFWAGTRLQRLDLATKVVQTIADTGHTTGGGTWSTSDVILFWPLRGSTDGGPLMQVSAAGGTPTPVTTVDRQAGQVGHRHASFLPDGRRFLYQSAPDNTIWAASLDGGSPKKLFTSDSRAVFVPPNWVVFVRQNTLLAQRFDPDRLEVTGDTWPLAEDVRTNETNGRSAFTVSMNGILVYRAGDQTQEAVLTWYRIDGTPLATVPDSGARYEGFQLFPDERHIVAHIHDDAQGGGDLWKIDLAQGTRTRLTSHPAHDFAPLVSPDGTEIAWASNRSSPQQILRKSASGTGEERVWIQMDRPVLPFQWSRNWLVFQVGGDGPPDLWVAPTDGKSPPRPYLATEFLESYGCLSPDEKWMAYHSTESGRMEVYVRPFPDAQANKWVISGRDGGGGPRWRADGQAILYGTAQTGGRLMSTPIKVVGSGLQIGTPVALASVPNGRGGVAITRDGQRGLMSTSPPATHTDAPLTVVVNWLKLVEKK